MPTLILTAIQKILEDRMTDKIMPTWLVQHTVMQAPGKTPISAVMLRSLEQPTEAKATLLGAELVDGQVSAREKYPKKFPVSQLWPRGRVIDGPTQPEPDASAFPEELPANLWAWVAAEQRPVIWSDAWPVGDNEFPSSAFRALVPYRSVRGRKRQVASKHRQSCVAALRVEVYPIG